MKPRLFCFGDSFVDWDIPKNHWTYYLSKHYDVIKFGKYGADNNSILFQLGSLPEFIEGDRVLMVFTEPGRLPRRYYGDRHDGTKLIKYMSPRYYRDKEFAEKLHHLKWEEGERWVNGERENEINFLKKLKSWMSQYKPIFITWSEYFHKPTSDFVELIQVSSNWEEGYSEERDFHPGPKGCYDMYKIIHNLLEIGEDIVDYEEEIKKIL